MEESLHDKINRETARIHWQELAPHFAAGNVITVGKELDLIDVAISMTEDNSEQLAEWMEKSLVLKTTDDQAVKWNDENQVLWAVVVKPWILVQETKD